MDVEQPAGCRGYRFAGLEIDLLTREVWRAGEMEAHRLQPRMFDLLVYLVRNRRRVVSKEEVARELWGGSAVCAHAIPQCMSALKKALGVGGLFMTHSRVGYRF